MVVLPVLIIPLPTLSVLCAPDRGWVRNKIMELLFILSWRNKSGGVFIQQLFHIPVVRYFT
jgi:hypothetical protein